MWESTICAYVRLIFPAGFPVFEDLLVESTIDGRHRRFYFISFQRKHSCKPRNIHKI